MENSKRIEWIDLVKFVGIFYMVWAHVGVQEKIYWYIQSFHMPLFFFISGYLFVFGKYKLKDYIFKRFKSLIIPYLLFGVANYIFWILLINSYLYKSSDTLVEPIKYLLTINTTTHLPIANALWFLTCLFIVEVLFFILIKYLKNNNKALFVVLIFFSLVGYFYPMVTKNRLYWGLDVAFTAIVFYGFGYLLKNNENRSIFKFLINPKIRFIILLFIIGIFCQGLNGHVVLMKIVYNNYFYYYISAIASILAYFMLARYLQNISFVNKSLIYKGLLYVGRNTITILALNQLMALILLKIVGMTSIKLSIKQIIITILIIIISVPISYLFDKYLPIFIGKRNNRKFYS